MAFKNLGIVLLCGNCDSELSMHTPEQSNNVMVTFRVRVQPCKLCTKSADNLKKSLESFLTPNPAPIREN